jgi:4-amino-4-deoxy-L-arabinose transferase-like glycosyltransferase
MSTSFGKSLDRRWLLILLLIFLIAAALRLHGLVQESPPGLEHDEVAHWLINRDILSGEHGIYFSEAYGHEAGYHYVQSLFILMLGDNILALRLPSALAGILLIAVSFTVARHLFDLRTAIISAALLAVLLWPVFYSRLGLRAISLPVLSGLSLYFWWQGWTRVKNPTPKNKSRAGRFSSKGYYTIAAILAGLSLYTYFASRVVPIFYLLLFLYLFFFHRADFRKSWPGIFRFIFIFFILAMPLTLYLLNNPGAEPRISEVNSPLLALVDGNIRPVIENALKVIAMFGVRGDPLWRQNVAFLPVFEPIIALFFYIGLAISLWRWREPRYALLILWLFTSAIPSIVTIDAPSSIRMINALPVIAIFPVIGLEVIHYLGRLSTVTTKLSTNFRQKVVLIILLFISGLYIVRTARATFQIWPDQEEVRFVWQEALTKAANYLDASNSNGPVAIGGWTPNSMDPPTMELTLKRDDLSMRYFDPQTALIIPTAPRGNNIRIIRPTILPMNPELDDLLSTWKAEPQNEGAFTIYELAPGNDPLPGSTFDAVFGGELQFLGYDWTDNCLPGETCQMVTYWRVQSPVPGSRRMFLHLVDQDDQVIVQDDALGAPAEHWQPDDLLIQLFSIDMPLGAEAAELRIGVYDPITGLRSNTSDGSDHVILEERNP